MLNLELEEDGIFADYTGWRMIEDFEMILIYFYLRKLKRFRN